MFFLGPRSLAHPSSKTGFVNNPGQAEPGLAESSALGISAAKQGAAGCFDEHKNEAPFQEAAKHFLSRNSFSLPSCETLVMRWILSSTLAIHAA